MVQVRDYKDMDQENDDKIGQKRLHRKQKVELVNLGNLLAMKCERVGGFRANTKCPAAAFNHQI